MDWTDFSAALVLLAEERVGTRLRAREESVDAAVAASTAALKEAARGAR